MDIRAYLVVENGLPYRPDEKIPLEAKVLRIGRNWKDANIDIGFDDLRISRNHAEISYEEGCYVIRDLPSSKNGIEVNGKLLEKGIPYVLHHNDQIALSKGAAILRFCNLDEGETQDIGWGVIGKSNEKQILSSKGLVVDIDRREVILNGNTLKPRISGIEFELLVILYRNKGKAVSHKDIVEWVWRDIPNRDIITRQNVSTLVYRLRECLGEYGKYIININAWGYMLE